MWEEGWRGGKRLQLQSLWESQEQQQCCQGALSFTSSSHQGLALRACPGPRCHGILMQGRDTVRLVFDSR